MKFTKKYFADLYPRNETIDGDYNSKDHAEYLDALFKLMGIHISTVYDFGFGKGTLLRDVSKKLQCSRVQGCDISDYACEELKKKKWAKDFKLEVSEIYNLKIPWKPFHLGICNSVLQYVEKDKLKKSIDVMAKSCKLLYLHVPTSEDYQILKNDLHFEDDYSIHRKNREYIDLLEEKFCFVSWGLLESKKFASHKTSPFSDSIYRF
jgi:ubiquinone/menaquinone biosynthesis C-methylase UbiE